MNRNSQVARAAMIVMVGFLLAKVTGIARQLVIAYRFGTSGELGAYFAAFTAPDLIFMLISGGALATAFIPILSDYLNQNKEERTEAWRMASNVLTVSLTLSTVVAAIVALFAPFLVENIIAPGDGFTPEHRALTVTLMRLILISTIIFSVSGLITGVLHTLQHFLLPAFAPLFYNLGIIFGALVLVPNFPEGQQIYGLAWGSIIGAMLHLAIQLPAIISHGVRLRPVFDLQDPGLRKVAILMAPRAAALGLIYSKFLMRPYLTSYLVDGSERLSELEYAWDLMQLPETIFASSIALAVFPTMSELWAEKNREELAEMFNQTIRTILTLTIPSAVGLIVLGTPIVRAFYERGEFNSDSSVAVSYALAFFAFGIVGHGLLEIVARLFYAQKDTLRPLYAAMLMLIVTWAVSWSLLDTYGIGGIALGDTLGVFVEVAILVWWMRHYLPEVKHQTTLITTGKIIISALAMAGAVQLWLVLIGDGSIYLIAGGGIVIGGLVYGGVALLVGLEEIKRVPRMILRRRG